MKQSQHVIVVYPLVVPVMGMLLTIVTSSNVKLIKTSLRYHPPRTILFEVFNDQKEARAFQYYLERSAFVVSTYQISTSRFWSTLGPQTSHAHPSVKHMLIAVASLQESFHHSCDPLVPPDQARIAHAYALQQYSKALKLLISPSHVETPPEILLTCYILFAAFEIFQNNPSLSTMHVCSGRRILREHLFAPENQRSSFTSDPIGDTLVPIFQHLGIDACAFSDDLPFQQNCWFTDDCCIEMDLRVPSYFFNLYEAHECMDGLLKCIFCATTEPTPAKKAALKKLKDIMPEYLRSLDMSMMLLPQNKNAKFEHGVRCLKVHHRVGTIMMETFIHSDEMIYDDYRQDFEFIVSQCTKLLDIDTKDGAMSRQLFSLHLGYIPPLFFAATRCRDPSIRRQAITVLHASRRRERVWDSCAAARVAERVMAIEERGLSVSGCRAVLRSNRIMLVNQTFNTGTCITHVQFKRAPWNDAAALEEEMIYWRADPVSRQILTPELTTKKILRAAGYAGNLLSCRISVVVVPRAPSNHAVLPPATAKYPAVPAERFSNRYI
jgi:hypothetical protein